MLECSSACFLTRHGLFDPAKLLEDAEKPFEEGLMKPFDVGLESAIRPFGVEGEEGLKGTILPVFVELASARSLFDIAH